MVRIILLLVCGLFISQAVTVAMPANGSSGSSAQRANRRANKRFLQAQRKALKQGRRNSHRANHFQAN